MNAFLRVSRAIVLSSVVALAGCNRDPAVRPESVAKSARNETSKNATDIPQVPEVAAAVHAVIQGLQENRPDVLWDALPNSYQRDVNDLLHLYAKRIDSGVWSRLLQRFGQYGNVLKERRPSFAHSMPESMPSWEAEFAVQYLVALSNLLPEIAGSDVADLDKMSTADTGAIMRTTGRRVMPELRNLYNALPDDAGDEIPADDGLAFEMLTMAILKEPRSVRAVVNDSSDNTATVTIKWSANASMTVPFVRVEGKWIPRQLRDQWTETVKFLKAYLPDSTALVASDHYRTAVGGMFEFIDRTVEEFEKPGNFDGIAAMSVFDSIVIIATTLIIYPDSMSTAAQENNPSANEPLHRK